MRSNGTFSGSGGKNVATTHFGPEERGPEGGPEDGRESRLQVEGRTLSFSCRTRGSTDMCSPEALLRWMALPTPFPPFHIRRKTA